MTATPSSTDACFDIKSAALTAMALVLKSTDLMMLADALDARFGTGPGPFDHDPVVIDLNAVRDVAAPIDFDALIALLRGHRLQPVGVVGGREDQMAEALAAGLGDTPALTLGMPSLRSAGADTPLADTPPVDASGAPHPAGAGRDATQASAPDELDDEPAQQVPLADPEPVPDPASTPWPAVPAGALVVDRPLRSGQQVYARGRDLVVLGVVNFGAEVIADGHIHVYAPLRGRAIAGAKGDTSARIFSLCMEPQLVSIAGTYRTTETAFPPDVLGKPAQVRLADDERLVVEALKL